MWLRYGVDATGVLVAIEEVPRGRTQLGCPYCGGELTAKKGEIVEHHFAHTGETCRLVADVNRERTVLPLYNSFNLHLSGFEFEFLLQMWRGKSIPEKMRSRFVRRGLVEWNQYKGRTGDYEFTKLGKIPVGALSLLLFNQIQEPMILERLEKLEDAVRTAHRRGAEGDLQDALTDLRLYRATVRRVLLNNLYYLQIEADGQTFYKIGVTQRDVSERVLEVEGDLRSHFATVVIKVLGTWPHRGNVEKYFKYRYQAFNHPIGQLTEYYRFDNPDDAKATLRDLKRMKPKELRQTEQSVMSGEPSRIEQILEKQEKARRRSLAIKLGMERAARWGNHPGRPEGGESDEEFLAKPTSQRVVEALNQGLSLRKAANYADVAVNTVRKVKALLESK